MESKYTPGLWETKQINNTDWCVCSGNICIAILWRRDNPEWNEANARLIAAAPDLLEALKDLQKAIREYGLLDIKKRFSLCTADAQAGAAIHKAEKGA